MPLVYPLKVIVLLLMLCVSTASAYAQSRSLDSLHTLVEKSSGREKVDALNALAFEQILVDFKLAQNTVKESRALSKELHYQKGLAEGNIYQAICEYHSGNTAFARRLFDEGLAIARKEHLTSIEGYGTTQLGNLHRNQGHYDSAEYWYHQSHEILRDSLNPWQLSVLYRNQGMLYRNSSRPSLELKYLTKSLEIRRLLKDKVLLTDILLLLGQFYINQGNYRMAKEHLERARSINSSDLLPEVRRNIDYNTALILLNENQYSEALKLLNDVSAYYLQTGNVSAYVKNLIEVADIFEEQGSNELSMKQCLEAIELSRKNGFKHEEVHATLILAWNYFETGQDSLAMGTARKVLNAARKFGFDEEEAAAENLLGNILRDRGEFKQSFIHFNKGLAIRQRLNNAKGTANILANMADTHFAAAEFAQAQTCLEKSIALEDSLENYRNKHWNLLRLARVKAALNLPEQSAQLIDSAVLIMNMTNPGVNRNTVEFQAGALELRRDLAKTSGDLQTALEFSIQIEKLKDSLNSANFGDRIAGLKTLFDLEKQSQELRLKNDQIRRQRLEIRQSRIMIAAAGIGLTLLVILLYVTFRYYRKTRALNEAIQEQNEEITAQSEELTETNKYLSRLNDELSEKNEEVRTQAEKLEKANGTLMLLNMELAEKTEELAAQSEELTESNQVILSLNQGLEEKVHSRTKQLEQAYKELDTFFYRSSHDFRRPLTTFMGLAEVAKITVTDPTALELFSKVKQTAIDLDRMLTKLLSISDLTADQQMIRSLNIRTEIENAASVYSQQILQYNIRIEIRSELTESFYSYPAFIKLILENLIENAIVFRDQAAPVIIIDAHQKDNGVLLTIEDNGIGIDDVYMDRITEMFFRASERSHGNGLGLYIVKKAVERLHGTLIFHRGEGKGTIVLVWFPFSANPNQ